MDRRAFGDRTIGERRLPSGHDERYELTPMSGSSRMGMTGICG
ncbi:hypothetical protein G155_00132 [Mycobacterium sp. VKM Ac-1817D]|nr:hypothetical protein G155_00132 [Mycobacterium sp. VKM Ac-1817D]